MASTKSILGTWQVATVAVLVLFICGCIVLGSPANDAYKQVNDLMKAKDFKGAIIALDRAIELDPKSAAAYSNRGSAYLSLERYQKAMDDYNKAIELNPYDAESYIMRGHLDTYVDAHGQLTSDYHHTTFEQHQKAIDDYSKAIQLDPNFWAAYVTQSALDPNLMDAYASRSQAYYAIGNEELGLKDFKMARELGYPGEGLFF
jgi:tetratricopeptide (TPR) repeat protein